MESDRIHILERPFGKHPLAIRRAAESELLYETILQQTTDAIVLFRNDRQIVEVNEAAIRMYGYSREEFSSMNGELLFPPEMREEQAKAFEARTDCESWAFETVHITKSGIRINVEIRSKRVRSGDHQYILSILHDLTALQRLEGERREAQKQYELIAASVPCVLFDYEILPSKQINLLFINNQCEELLEIHRDALLMDFEQAKELIHPEDAARFAADLQLARSGVQLMTGEYRAITPSKRVKWIQVSSRVVPNSEGRGIRRSGYMLDITSRKIAEEEIQHLASFAELSPNILLEVESDGHILLANNSARKETGWSASSHSYLPKDINTIVSQLRDKGENSTVNREIELGSRVYELTVLRDDFKGSTRVYGMDVTGLKQTQSALERSIFE